MHRRVLALLVFPLMSTGLGLRRCAYRWTRFWAEVAGGHSLRDPRGVHCVAQKCASCHHGDICKP